MKGETISIANQKGGVGKTATVAALAQGMRRLYGKNYLILDLDPQCNLTQLHGATNKDNRGTTENLISGSMDAIDCLQETRDGGMIIPGSALLSTLDARISTRRKLSNTDAQLLLYYALQPIRRYFDYILIDCPPSVGILTINALAASHRVIIPVASGDTYSITGAYALRQNIQAIKRVNPSLKVDGVLITKESRRTTLAKTFKKRAESLAEELKTRVYSVSIRQAVAVQEAALLKESLFDYAPDSPVTTDYCQFIAEVVRP